MPTYLSILAAPTQISFYMSHLPQHRPYMQMPARGPGYRSGSEGLGAASRLYCGIVDPVHDGLPHPGHHRIASVQHLSNIQVIGSAQWQPRSVGGLCRLLVADSRAGRRGVFGQVDPLDLLTIWASNSMPQSNQAILDRDWLAL